MTLIRHATNSSVLALLLTATLSSSIIVSTSADIVINEIAYQGTGEDVCEGRDWIELANTNDDDVDLTGYVLHDDKGAMDPDAKTLGDDSNNNTSIASGGFLLMCRGTDFEFGIGSDDTITLLDASGSVVDSVSLAESSSSSGEGSVTTFARIDGGGEALFQHTTAATPGAANILEEPVSLEELLANAYAAGTPFFGSDEFGDVIDIDVTIDDEGLSILQDHPAWEIYVDFSDLRVTTSSGAGEGVSSAEDNVATSSAGRIRVKGQSTNTITACLGLRNVPFNIEFETPFFGMEQMYLRNHLADPSYMRDAMAHYMLGKIGLPSARTRPARLFMNGEYVGFYTLMEAPTQGHVLQQNFGAFDPEKTGIFKMKSALTSCPFQQLPSTMDDESSANDNDDGTYYFEKGRHKEDTPVLGMAEFDACGAFFFGEMAKETADVGRGYEEHNRDCAETMIELGRVDRDYGPKSNEDSMKDFLDKYYDEDVDDLNDYIDTDQWLRSIAFMSLVLHQDSPAGLINNWYLATTNGGEGDWKIVQYDHNNMATSDIAALFCGQNCAPGAVYWPILRPTCGPSEDHEIVGRVLNSPENIEKYVSYVREYLDILSSDEVLGNIKGYGEMIKEYAVKDPLNFYYLTVEDYETVELGEDTSDYNVGTQTQSLYKFLRVRFPEVRKQLEAIEAGNLPGGGEYDARAKCPDWRDPDGTFVPAGSTIGENCAIPDCAMAAPCYDSNPLFCSEDGEMTFEDCKTASPFCDSCFPYSRCGANLYVDKSPTLVESASCGPELAEGCREASQCFSHSTGICDFTGTLLTVECQVALPACVPCFPYSRCGSGELVEDVVLPEVPSAPVDDNNDSGAFVESDECTPDFAALGCADGAPCFDHAMGFCQEDGTFSIPECNLAAPCAPCFPNSRCGSLVVADNDEEEEVEVVADNDKEEEEVVADDKEEEEPAAADDEGEEPEPKPEEESSESASSGPATRGIVVAGWLALLSSGLWCIMVVVA